uniref:IQ motif containing K n=1 Tax=Meleagris gallopavo TaxID=9103 RepID=A0A803XZU5_MELGA
HGVMLLIPTGPVSLSSSCMVSCWRRWGCGEKLRRRQHEWEIACLQVKAVLFCAGSPQEYLEYYIFPVLLPGMTELLHQAKKEKCFERKRTKFIACDFLTEWLYNPREPLPLSFFLSEEEASVIIQAFWRGYRVRCDREVQELRQWQKQLRDEKIIFQRVEEFWARQEAKGR